MKYNHADESRNDITNLKICSWNIHGLDKFKLSDNVLCNYFKEFQLIMLNETWSSGTDGFHLDGFTFHDFDRKYKHPDAIRYSGG